MCNASTCWGCVAIAELRFIFCLFEHLHAMSLHLWLWALMDIVATRHWSHMLLWSASWAHWVLGIGFFISGFLLSCFLSPCGDAGNLMLYRFSVTCSTLSRHLSVLSHCLASAVPGVAFGRLTCTWLPLEDWDTLSPTRLVMHWWFIRMIACLCWWTCPGPQWMHLLLYSATEVTHHLQSNT